MDIIKENILIVKKKNLKEKKTILLIKISYKLFKKIV